MSRRGHTEPKNYKGVIRDFGRNALFLVILFSGFIYDILGPYTQYIWVGLVPFLLYARLFRINKITLATIIFSVSYIVPIMWQKEPLSFGNAMVVVVYPLTFYYAGIYLCRRCRDSRSIMWILLLCILSYAAWPIVANISDFIDTGEIVNLSRGFDLDKKYVLATHQNMMMAMAIGGLGMIFLRARTKDETRFKWVAVVVAFLALFSAMHLLNRTALVLALVSCICGLFWGGGGVKRFVYLIVIVGVISAIAYVAIIESQWGQILEGFNSREQMSGYTANSAGGRTIRWMRGIQAIMTHPWGCEGIHVGFQKTFSHDFWLDIGVRGGWIPMIVMIIITVWWMQSFWGFIKTRGMSGCRSGYVVMVLVTMLLQMAVEPVVEGQLPLLLMMYLNWGFMKYDYNLKAHSEEHASHSSEEHGSESGKRVSESGKNIRMTHHRRSASTSS